LKKGPALLRRGAFGIFDFRLQIFDWSFGKGLGISGESKRQRAKEEIKNQQSEIKNLE